MPPECRPSDICDAQVLYAISLTAFSAVTVAFLVRLRLRLTAELRGLHATAHAESELHSMGERLNIDQVPPSAAECRWIAAYCFGVLLIASECFWLLLIASECLWSADRVLLACRLVPGTAPLDASCVPPSASECRR